MGDNSRDEKLRFVYEVEGKEGLDTVTEALAKTGEEGGAAGEKLKQAADDLGQLLDRVHDVEALQALEDRLGALDEKLADAKDRLAKLSEVYAQSGDSSAEVARQYNAAQKAVADLADQHDRLAVRVSTSQAALNAAGVDTKNLGAAHDELSKKAQESATKLVESAAAANRFGGVRQLFDTVFESFKRGVENVTEFGKKLGEITGIAGVVTGALATLSGYKFFEKGVEEARSGEVALAKLKAAVDGNSESFEHLKEAAEKAAESVGTTSNVAVETLTKLTGLLGSADAAAKALPATLTLGKAAQIDFAESAELVATTLKAFNLEADQAGTIADKLAAIAARTGVNLAELARGAAQVAPLAKEAGVGFDGVAAALAELSSKGFDAQKSNAALRELFLALSQPTSKLRQDLVGLGIDTSSLSSILDGLQKAGDRGTEALQQLSAKGRAGVAALVQGGSADLARFQQVLNDSVGAAGKTAKLLGDTFDGALTSFGRTIDSLAEDAVKGALPAVSDEIKKLNEELKQVGKTDLFDKLKTGIKDAVGVAVEWFDKLVHSVDWPGLGKQISEFGDTVKSTLGGVGAAASETGAVLSVLGRTVSGLYNAIAVFFNGVAMLASEAMSWITKFAEGALRVFGLVSSTARGFADDLNEYSRQYAENAQKFWERTKDSALGVAAAVASAGQSTKATADAAKDAAPKHEEHAKSLEKAGDAAKQAAPELHNVAAATDKVKQSALSATPSIDDLIRKFSSAPASLKDMRAAASNLGFTLQSDLKKAADEAANSFALISANSKGTAADIANVRAAFLDYAKKQLEATQNLSEGEKASAQAMLESRAAALGLSNTLHDLIQSSNAAGIAAQEAGKGFLLGVQQAAEGAKYQQEQMAEGAKKSADYSAAMDKVRDSSASLQDRTKSLGDAMNSASSDTDRAAIAAEGADLRMQGAGEAAAYLTKAMEGARSEFAQVSDAAAHAFDTAFQGALQMQGIMPQVSAAVDKTKNSMELLREAAQGDIIGFNKWMYALAQAQEYAQQKLDNQRQGLADQIKLYDTLGTAAQQNFGVAGRGAQALLADLQAQSNALQQGNSGFDLLGKQELGPLQQALDGAIARTQKLIDEAVAAKKQFQDMASSVNDALLQEQGNQSALEDERHKKQLDDLEAAAKTANELNSDTYQKAVQQEDDLHALRMKNIAEQEAAAKKSSTASSASSTSGSPAPSPTPYPPSPAPAPQPSPVTLPITLDFKASGSGIGSAGNLDAANLQQLAQQLMPYIIQSIQQAARRAGQP